MSRPGRGGADLLRAVGLLADGPVPWGRPVAGRGPGLYVVELPTSPVIAPVDLGRVGAWLTHRPELRMDGARPSGKELAARLSAFWLPGEPVIFAGSTEVSIGGRVTALYRHVPGDRRPHPEGQWLHVLFGMSAARVWWASTDAPDEALDAFLTAFAEGVEPETRAALHDPAVVLPFATTRRPTGERKAHGLTGYVTPAERVPPPPPTHVTELPPGAAEGVEESEAGPGMRQREVAPPPDKPVRRRPDDGSGPDRTTAPLTPAPKRSGRAGEPAAPAGAGNRASGRAGSGASGRAGGSSGGSTRSGGTGIRAARAAEKAAEAAARAIPPTVLTPDGLERLQAEHAELTGVKRPAVIARIRTAKEHGDLKENAEYHAAREEQSFLEGRVLAIEAILRNHVVIEMPAGGHSSVHLGSTVTIEDDFGQVTYTIVGSTEANPTEGRISSSSPVGSALLGRAVGDQVVVRTPRGEARYRVVAIE